MPWGRVDDTHYDHPKLLEIDRTIRNACDGLYWRSISWSNNKLTDGHVPAEQLRRLDARQIEIDALVHVGMFEEAPGGVIVHDFLDFNDSRGKVLADREAARERMRRRRSRNVRANAAGTSRDVQEPRAPDSRPGPSRPVLNPDRGGGGGGARSVDPPARVDVVTTTAFQAATTATNGSVR